MTLVAAIKIHDVPVLLGDLMLSERDRAGTRRKIIRLRPNLAVGWADTHIVARAIFRELNEVLSDRPTPEDVQCALGRFSAENGRLNVQLTGWVLGDYPTAFMWDGNYPDQFVLGDQFTIGSGAGVIWQFLNNRPLDAPPTNGLVSSPK